MARCSRCNKFMLFSSRSGYCSDCIAIAVNQEKETRRKAEEEARIKAELERKKLEEERKRLENERKRLEEERKRHDEAQRKAEEERKCHEEALRKAEEERKRQEEAQRKAEEERRQRKEALRKAEEEHKQEERRRIEEQQRRAEEEQQRRVSIRMKEAKERTRKGKEYAQNHELHIGIIRDDHFYDGNNKKEYTDIFSLDDNNAGGLVTFNLKDKGTGEIESIIDDILKTPVTYKEYAVAFEMKYTANNPKAFNVVTLSEALSSDLMLRSIQELSWTVHLRYFIEQKVSKELFKRFVGILSEEESDEYKYNVLEDGSVVITEYKGDGLIVSIPNRLNGNKVIGLGYSCFSNKKLKAIDIPEGITYIYAGAFSNCVNLKKIKLPNSIEVIGDGAFGGCESLQTISIPINVRRFGKSVFRNCKALNTIFVPPEHPFLLIDDGILYNQKSKALILCPCTTERTEYSILSGTRIIEDYAFAFCKNINNINIPTSVKKIEERAFVGCINLTQDIKKRLGHIFVYRNEIKSSSKVVEIPFTHKWMMDRYGWHYSVRGIVHKEECYFSDGSIEIREGEPKPMEYTIIEKIREDHQQNYSTHIDGTDYDHYLSVFRVRYEDGTEGVTATVRTVSS